MLELVDIYPTLCDLCGIPVPEGQLDGDSFRPVLVDHKAKTKEGVYIQWEGGDNRVDRRYNYAEWRKDGEVRSRMLFDHKADPEENCSRAGRPKYRAVVEECSGWLGRKKAEEHR